MRAFLAYDIEDIQLKKNIEGFESELSSTGADLKIVKPDILHFTMRFFGEIDKEQMEEIISSLEGHVEGFSHEVKFRGVGVFPSERRISVIWVGTDEESSQKLREQARKMDERLKALQGIPRDDPERFSPHLTVARVRSARNKPALVQLITGSKDRNFGIQKIEKLKLKLSELTPSGPNYSDLHVFT